MIIIIKIILTIIIKIPMIIIITIKITIIIIIIQIIIILSKIMMIITNTSPQERNKVIN